jgi:serine/threonine-protein kinase SRPK3
VRTRSFVLGLADCSYTDIKLDNILTTLPDDEEAILTSLVNAEREDPSPRKIVDDNRAIYKSRAPKYPNLTYPIICDLGMGRFDQDEYEGLIQPLPYRAPEVILQMKWNSSVDIWNMGVLVSDPLHIKFAIS